MAIRMGANKVSSIRVNNCKSSFKLGPFDSRLSRSSASLRSFHTRIRVDSLLACDLADWAFDAMKQFERISARFFCVGVALIWHVGLILMV